MAKLEIVVAEAMVPAVTAAIHACGTPAGRATEKSS